MLSPDIRGPMHPSQASIPKLMDILGQASTDLKNKDLDEQAIVLKHAADQVRVLAATLRTAPASITADAMPRHNLIAKALELVSKVTVVHNSVRENKASETEIELAVAEALDTCADLLIADADILLK